MKRKITFLLAALLLMSGLSWAQQITWSASDQGYTNGEAIESVSFNDYVAGAFFKGTNNNAPKYYNTGAAIRCYGGNYFTITSDYALTEIVLGFGSGDGSNAITSDVGTYDNGTWTGSANEVTFTINGTSGHRRIASFTITYDEGGTPTPSINANNVEIAYNATEGAIEYTINNPVEGGVLTANTDAEWLTIGTVGETVPFTCSMNDDGERMATVTLTYTYDTDQTVTKNVTVTQDNNPNAPGTENNPYTVAQAHAAIDANYGTQGVYATGIVSEIVTAYSSQYGNITFDIVDAAGDQEFLRVYRCAGEEAANVTVGDIAVVYGNLILYNNSIYEFAQGCQVVSLEHPVITDPYITAENVNIEFDATSGSIAYEIGNPVNDGVLTASVPEESWITLGDDFTSPIAFTCSANQASSPRTETVTLTYTYGESNITMDVTVTQAAAPQPSLTVTPATVNAPVEGADGTLAITYENIPELISFDYYFCDAEGNELQETPDWIDAEIQEENENYSVYYIIDANEGEARTAYFKVYTLVGDEEVYSMVTVNQAAYVAPTYAALPFSFDGGRNDIESTDGLYQEGLGGDYSSAPRLKFDGSGDYLLLQFNERPDTLTFIIKGNSFSGGTFTVQTSEDGETFTDFAVYTNDNLSNMAQFEEFTTLGENVRYIKWVYTEKVSGNVGLGNITLAKYGEPVIVASITVDPAEVNVNGGYNTDYLSITYENIVVETHDSFDVQFYDAEGEEIDQPEWLVVQVNDIWDNPGYYHVSYTINPNQSGEARSAYFKVYAMDAETNLVYSNLVTINQEAYVAPVASITIDPDFITVDAGMHYGDDFLPLTYENIIVENAQSFGLQFYTAEGEETGMPTWFYAMVTPQTGSDAYQVTVATMPNDGEARSTYFKVYAYDADSTLVYSNLATVTQSAPVFDYAVLPFVWEGGITSDFAALNGTTVYGVSDYGENQGVYRMKLDGTGDYIMVKTDSQPGTVTIGVKMVGGSNTSTITVQGSADGETFTDIEVLTISGAQNDILTLETTTAFGGDDRYVKLLFTKGSNVGVGPITITKGTAPSITLTPDTFNLDAVGPLNGMHLPTATVTYHNFEITQASDFHVQFYNAEGEEQEMPTWLLHTEVSGPITDSSSYQSIYQSISIVTANEGPARSAYYRVYAFDADSIPVYSNLVTYNQAGVPQPSIIVNPDVVNVDAALHTEQLPITYENIVVENYASFGVQFYTAEGEETETPNWLFVQATGMNEEYQVTCAIISNEGDARSAYFKMYAYTADSTLIYSNLVTINQAAYMATENWVMTNLADLKEGDVFVIVGVYDVDESSFAMPNNSTGAPSAVEVTMDGNTLLGDIDDNLKWNLSIGEDGYIFYPNGETETWLYCTNTNNGVRVGTNENNVFSMTTEGYLFNNATGRYIGIYNSQDWRCYTSINNNIKEQTFAFYKRVDGSEIETYTLDITGYGDSDGGYHLIASPVSMIRPTADNGFLTDEYDLYYFNQSKQDFEWCNYEAKHFNIAAGKGYLYASEENTTLTFEGIPYNGDGTISLVKDDNAVWSGWNLVGNPFSQTAYIDRDFYVMNEDGSEILTDASNGAIEAMQGFFVIAEEDGETLTFSTEAPNQSANLTMNLSQSRGAVIDRTIVRFGEGRQLPKFQLNAESTKLYIPQGNEDFAVVRSAAYGEMPVNFKAQSNGTYTISVNAENVEASYLHLIDNMTGNDIDLLQVPFYSFKATTSDYVSRFRLVFNITGVEENTTGTEPFAFFNGSEWVVSNIGNATLQMVDLTGRILSSESISGNATVSTSNLSTGIYMLRLVNGENVKTQKMVVK